MTSFTWWGGLALGLAAEFAVIATAHAAQVGDCDGDGVVTMREALMCQQIRAGTLTLNNCSACDANGDSKVDMTELATAQVNAVTDACAKQPAACPNSMTPTGAAADIGRVGDCNGSGVVTLKDAANCFDLAVGTASLSVCEACDGNQDGVVSFNEVVQSLDNAQQDACAQVSAACDPCAQFPAGCLVPTAGTTPSVGPTATPTPVPTATASPSAMATETAVPTETATPTATAIATPTTTPLPLCVGDCDGNGEVEIGELITLVNIALGNADPTACGGGIPNGTQVDIALIIQAVNRALEGCG